MRRAGAVGPASTANKAKQLCGRTPRTAGSRAGRWPCRAWALRQAQSRASRRWAACSSAMGQRRCSGQCTPVAVLRPRVSPLRLWAADSPAWGLRGSWSRALVSLLSQKSLLPSHSLQNKGRVAQVVQWLELCASKREVPSLSSVLAGVRVMLWLPLPLPC